MGFVANVIRFPAVQTFWKSVNIWQSYGEFNGGNFFETVYIKEKLNSSQTPHKNEILSKTTAAKSQN